MSGSHRTSDGFTGSTRFVPTDPMSLEKVIVSWSGGKDSAMALRAVQQSGLFAVQGLLTTCTEGFRRVSVHGVRCSLLHRQIAALGLPLVKTFIPRECSNADYETRTLKALAEARANGVTKVVFGDLFLEDIRRYRDDLVRRAGMEAIYPLWSRDTTRLAQEFIRDGFAATLVCVDPRRLDQSFAGRSFDPSLLKDLPPGVDPCGENGEFHTFVLDGPIFNTRVRCRLGQVSTRDSFHYADLLPIR